MSTQILPTSDDGDSGVDLDDFLAFTHCFNGPNRPYATADPACTCLDSDDDGVSDSDESVGTNKWWNDRSVDVCCPEYSPCMVIFSRQ